MYKKESNMFLQNLLNLLKQLHVNHANPTYANAQQTHMAAAI